MDLFVCKKPRRVARIRPEAGRDRLPDRLFSRPDRARQLDARAAGECARRQAGRSRVPSPKSRVQSRRLRAPTPYEGGLAAASADGVDLSSNPKSKTQNPKSEDADRDVRAPSTVSAVEPLNQPTETLAIPQFSPEILPESPENAHITAQPPDVFARRGEKRR